MPVYYGWDDNVNTAGWVGVCVGFYLIYKAVTSSHYVTSTKVKELDTQANKNIDFSISDAEVDELAKEPAKAEIVLKGSLANLSLKEVTADSKTSKDAINEASKLQIKIALKGSLAGLSFKKSERASPSITEPLRDPTDQDLNPQN